MSYQRGSWWHVIPSENSITCQMANTFIYWFKPPVSKKRSLIQKAHMKLQKKKKMRDETAGRQFPDRWFSEYSTSLLSAKMSLFVLWYLSKLKDVPLHTEVSWLSLFHKMNHWSESRWAYEVFFFSLYDSTLSQYHESENDSIKKINCNIFTALQITFKFLKCEYHISDIFVYYCKNVSI